LAAPRLLRWKTRLHSRAKHALDSPTVAGIAAGTPSVPMKFMVTGAGGLLGTTVVGAARGRGHEVLPLDRAQLDVTRLEEVRRHVARGRPDWIVHCAAYTHVDRAESEPDRAYTINRDGARIVAEAAREVGAGILYVSTDFVFAGDRRMPYRPSDPVGPLGVYGRSKLAGEQAVQAAGGLWLIARTGWLY
jgi:dTDP-4-dehydrorhamnose reductase